MLSKPFSTFLNVSRWLAAFLVVIAHARHLLLVDYKFLQEPNLAIKGLYFVTGLGHESVVIFFVISGFLVGGLTLKKWRESGPDVLLYAVARTSRIYTVLLPALIFGAMLDLTGLHWFNDSALYTESPRYQSSMNSVIATKLGMDTFAGNAAMLQGIVVQAFGSNAPLWSLAYEWWYYVVFALVGAAPFTRGRKRGLLMAGAVVLACLLPGKLMLWMSVWALGILAYVWIDSGKAIPPPVIGLLIFLGTLVASRLSHNVENIQAPESLFSGYARDLLLGIAYAICLASVSKLRWELLFGNFHRAAAEFSYTTYSIHFPAMVLLVALAYQYGIVKIQVSPTLFSVTAMTVIVVLVYLFCYVFSLLFERHTDGVRRYLTGVLRPASKAPAAAKVS
jgi:peptidoglycan/LPS O-acetylase OafA/YrhL